MTILATLLLQVRSVEFLVAGRCIQGMASGVYYVLTAVFIKEFPPVELVGKFGPIMQLSFMAGMVYTYFQSYILSLLFPVSTYWRIVFALPILFLSIQVYNILTKYPYETPKYLVLNNRIE